MTVSLLRQVGLTSGNIFIANMREAHPPVMPSKEASTPAELFPEVNHAFLEQEHHRMARFIEHSAGCVDLRDVTGVKLCEVTSDRALRTDHEQEQELEDGEGRQRLGKQSERSFEVALTSGSATRFEAHTPSDASEWVEKLNALQSYWKRRHRVE